MNYSEKVMDHFMNPRNMGEIENASGVGTVGNAKCGDIMKVYLDIEDGIVKDAKFKTFGCGAAVATSSMATELIKGKSIQDALKITNKVVMEALDGLPPVKVHCSCLAEVWKMMGRMHDKYLIADGSIYILGGRNTYNYFLGDFEKYKNYDRDVLVICENPQKENSVSQLLDYFENIWKQDDCAYFHEDKKLADKASVKKAALRMEEEYKEYAAEYKECIFDSDYTDETFETEKITLVSNPIHTGAKEPVVWYTLGELMKNAKERVKIHTPYIICNEMMYNTWADVAKNVSEFSVMTNSAANNGNPFGSADYALNSVSQINQSEG